jgi:hypothetical protein
MPGCPPTRSRTYAIRSRAGARTNPGKPGPARIGANCESGTILCVNRLPGRVLIHRMKSLLHAGSGPNQVHGVDLEAGTVPGATGGRVP